MVTRADYERVYGRALTDEEYRKLRGIANLDGHRIAPMHDATKRDLERRAGHRLTEDEYRQLHSVLGCTRVVSLDALPSADDVRTDVRAVSARALDRPEVETPAWLAQACGVILGRFLPNGNMPRIACVRPRRVGGGAGHTYPGRGIVLMLDPRPEVTLGLACHELAHWIRLETSKKDDGVHDAAFFAKLEDVYRFAGIPIELARAMENGLHPKSWARERW